MLIVSLVFAVVMIAVLAAVYRFGGGVIFLIAVLLGFLFFLSPLLLGTLSVLTVTALVCRVAGASVKKFLVYSGVAAVLTHGVVAFMALQPILELRRKYPIESLRHRLAYEERALAAIDEEHHPTVPSNAADISPNINPAERVQEIASRDDRLVELEDQLERQSGNNNRQSTRYRTMALRRLYNAHQSVVDEFINSPGFGVGRMAAVAMPTEENIELPPAPPVPQPQKTKQGPLPSSDDGTAPLQSVDAEREGGLAMRHALASLHLEGTTDFANPLSYGYVRDLDHTIGFQSHAFSQLPRLPETSPETNWKIGKVELVSLLKHDRPQVYQSKNLPNMQELETVPTRSLDEFESAALDKLRGGEVLIVSTGSHEIRTLGSLRAAKQCIECHQVDRGTLLGAFTYHLFSDTPADQPKVEKVLDRPAS